MIVNSFNGHDRELMVKFTCRRCKCYAFRTLKECYEEVDDPTMIHNLKPPDGWGDGGFYYPLLCHRCAEDYKKFMNNEKLED